LQSGGKDKHFIWDSNEKKGNTELKEEKNENALWFCFFCSNFAPDKLE
jgi:hypothetical protein